MIIDKHPKFQKLFWVISLSKLVSSFLYKGPTMRLLIGPSLNHLSCQKDNKLFLLGIHLMPFLNIVLPLLRAFHVVEQDLFLKGESPPLLVYLCARTLAHGESFSWWIASWVWQVKPNSFLWLIKDQDYSPFLVWWFSTNWLDKLLFVICCTPNEVTTQSINTLGNLWWKGSTLHWVIWDSGKSSLCQNKSSSKR